MREKTEILFEIPATWELREINIRFPSDSPSELTLCFEGPDKDTSFMLRGPDSLTDILELRELQIDNIRIRDARADQREGFPVKLQFDTDRGLFEIWAKEYAAH